MRRYIDADAYAAEMKTRQDACKEIMDAAKEDENWEVYDRMGAMFSIFVEAKLTLDNMPTIDAVPVVHGEWIETEMGYDDYAWVCTVCGEPWVLNAGTPSENNMNYCPNCGAKMDGERRTE